MSKRSRSETPPRLKLRSCVKQNPFEDAIERYKRVQYELREASVKVAHLQKQLDKMKQQNEYVEAENRRLRRQRDESRYEFGEIAAKLKRQDQTDDRLRATESEVAKQTELLARANGENRTLRSSLVSLKNKSLKERSEHSEQNQQLRSRIRSLVYAHTEAFCTLLEIDIDSDMHNNESQAATSATETVQDVFSQRESSAERATGSERPADGRPAPTTDVADKVQTAEEAVTRDHHSASESESISESEQ